MKENIKFKLKYPITKNRDSMGRILTYSVKLPSHTFEFNSLKDAKIMASDEDDFYFVKKQIRRKRRIN